MTLDDEFPKAPVDFKTDDDFLKSPIRYECAECSKPMDWFQLSLCIHFCSRQCFEKYAAEHLLNRH